MVNALASELRKTEDEASAGGGLRALQLLRAGMRDDAPLRMAPLSQPAIGSLILQIGAKMKVLDKDGDGQVCHTTAVARDNANPLHPPQITEQEIKDGLALTMKRPPTQEEVAAVVR